MTYCLYFTGVFYNTPGNKSIAPVTTQVHSNSVNCKMTCYQEVWNQCHSTSIYA